jgi:hypothetical protein
MGIYMKRKYRVLGRSGPQPFATGQQDGRKAVAWAQRASIPPQRFLVPPR